MTHSETLYPNHSFTDLAEKIWTLRARLDRYRERYNAEHFSPHNSDYAKPAIHCARLVACYALMAILAIFSNGFALRLLTSVGIVFASYELFTLCIEARPSDTEHFGYALTGVLLLCSLISIWQLPAPILLLLTLLIACARLSSFLIDWLLPHTFLPRPFPNFALERTAFGFIASLILPLIIVPVLSTFIHISLPGAVGLSHAWPLIASSGLALVIGELLGLKLKRNSGFHYSADAAYLSPEEPASFALHLLNHGLLQDDHGILERILPFACVLALLML